MYVHMEVKADEDKRRYSHMYVYNQYKYVHALMYKYSNVHIYACTICKYIHLFSLENVSICIRMYTKKHINMDDVIRVCARS